MSAIRLSLIGSLALLAAFTGSTYGQSLTSRTSLVNYNYVYGAGGDSHVGSDSIPDVSLVLSDIEGTGFTGSTSGVLPGGQPYGAGVFADINHEFAITGSIGLFQSISASAFTHVSATATGLGSSVMNASNPGNELILTFTVADPVNFHLAGSITLPVGGAVSSLVALQYWDGIVWQNGIFNSLFLPGSQGAFDVNGSLAPGLYRMNSAISLHAGGNEDFTGTFNYQLTIPEPATAFLLAAGVFAIGCRRHR
ncbi:MAG: PEP-CTERM sorting domain-containing protein [Planctomycetes bacterium]|nr:PEP-CTERM sorting domain-containing protein [Planctomycetota bacterium]